jgi:hypothetical protein
LEQLTNKRPAGHQFKTWRDVTNRPGLGSHYNLAEQRTTIDSTPERIAANAAARSMASLTSRGKINWCSQRKNVPSNGVYVAEDLARVDRHLIVARLSRSTVSIGTHQHDVHRAAKTRHALIDAIRSTHAIKHVAEKAISRYRRNLICVTSDYFQVRKARS